MIMWRKGLTAGLTMRGVTPPSSDPWNASADTERSFAEVTSQPTRRRRYGILVAVAALVVAVAAGILLATTRHPQRAVDTSGKQACTIANNWNQSRPGFISQSIVMDIHNLTIRSTNPDLVDRGNQLFDTWMTVSSQQLVGDITPEERDLRALVPLAQFRTSCLQAGFGPS